MIVTERLILRVPKASDLADIHQIFCDDEAMAYWSRPAHRSIEETRAWLQPILDDPKASPFDYFIEFNGKIVGKLGSWELPKIGYAVARAYWGRGIAEEALRGFIAHMREAKVCDHLFADVDPRNARSIHLLQKFGFQLAGQEKNSIHTHMGWCDSNYYTLSL